MNIMIVEDDEILAEELKEFLIKWGYSCEVAHHFEDITIDYKIYHPHLILMDINLPFYDGFYWCHKIREISEVPIIYISSRNDDKDKIMAIAQGGDDYVEKPFSLELLKAKIEAILRRTYQYKVKDRIYIHSDLYFVFSSMALIYRDSEIELTRSEKRILAKLLKEKSNIVSREELMLELWNTDEFVSDGTLTTMICRLRNKLKTDCYDELIKTKKGQGYYIE